MCDKSSPDAAPLAVAGADQSVLVGSTVTLDGSNSRDPDGKPLTYLWTLRNKPTGSTAALSSNTASLPTFVADKAGVYVAQLVVNDGGKSSALVFITITTAEQNAAPVANAGRNQSVRVSSEDNVELDGSFSSDANRDPLVYTWKLESIPSGSTAALSSTSAVRPTFKADKAGSYVASLIVSDGSQISNFATVTVTASAVNSAPTARIGAVAPVAAGKTITLDGGASSDPDRDPLTYTWVLISQPTGSSETLSSTSIAKPTLQVSTAGNYVASLVVNDGTANSDYAFITVTAMDAPVAIAKVTDGTTPITGSITSGTALTLDATESSDTLKTALTYQWTITAAPTGNLVKLVNPAASKATFTPVATGDYVITLVVSNGTVDSKTVTLLIKVI
ncbi:PKD domain-containing protein [Limnohabitans sp.]|uniref:PKD domain-containing protein n=1 Tax=Limnohabitans sp. TaxID=1907725 RepID=UPI0031FE0FA0